MNNTQLNFQESQVAAKALKEFEYVSKDINVISTVKKHDKALLAVLMTN